MSLPRFPEPQTVLLGKYRVDSLIGEGGMGAVIKAHHIELDEFVAIKCLLPEMLDRKEVVSRFLREARAAAKLKGQHIARVLDSGKLATGVPYIVMEYLEGADLNAIIKHHGWQEPPLVVDLMLQACEAIAEAHSIGIIHRDIKASNFFVTQPANQAPVLKVLDFGIATAPEGTSDLTSTQSVMGTPAYMAPEQMRSSRTADVRSDIWSLGVVLYEMLEGRRPFRAEAYSELCLMVGMDPPAPMQQPQVSDALRAVVMKCLEKSVERRYQTVAELAFDLMPFASEPNHARSSVEQCARLLGRRGSRAFDLARAPDDRTPAPVTPTSTPVARLTPQPISPDEDPVPLHARPAGRREHQTPTSGQPKTPTSIHTSNGQVSITATRPPEPTRSRRGLVIGLTAVSMLAIAAIVVYGFVLPATTPAAAIVPATQPPPPEQVKPPQIAEPAPVPHPAEPSAAAIPLPAPTPMVMPVKPAPTPIATPVTTLVKPKLVPRPITRPTPKIAPKAEPGGDLYIKRQ